MNVQQRQKVERQIVVAAIKGLHNAGYAITVNDGEEDVVEASLDHNEVLGAMFSTDEDWLHAVDSLSGVHLGWVRFIYGNDGPDVISDYTLGLEDALSGANELAEQLEERLYG